MDQRTGEIIPKRHQLQVPAIPDLEHDWSTIVDREGNQVQTVGTHGPLSRALNSSERDRPERTGLCMGCHREMTNAELWSKVAQPGRLLNQEHIDLLNRLLRAEAEKR